jgi:glucose/arabinose dehydrogenase
MMVGLYPVPGSPDEAVVITQNGFLWRVSLSGSFEPALFADLSDRVFVGTEEGLLSLAFAPGYPADPRVYVWYNKPRPSDEPLCDLGPDRDPVPYYTQEILSRFTVDTATKIMDANSEQELLFLNDCGQWHNGGQILFGDDGYLYLGVGDEGYRDGVFLWDNGQDPTTVFGSIIRIDVSGADGYSVPSDNPFVDGQGGNADEIWAYGFRNPWRMSFDRLTGDLWVGDVQQWLWEEIDIVRGGGNYGWNKMEAFDCFGGPCDKTLYDLPVAAYCHGQFVDDCPYKSPDHHQDCAVIGGYVYRGSKFPELYGWYIFADFCSGRIRAYDTNNPGVEPLVIVEAPPPASVDPSAPPPKLVTSFAELPDGELVIITFNNAIYRLEKKP